MLINQIVFHDYRHPASCDPINQRHFLHTLYIYTRARCAIRPQTRLFTTLDSLCTGPGMIGSTVYRQEIISSRGRIQVTSSSWAGQKLRRNFQSVHNGFQAQLYSYIRSTENIKKKSIFLGVSALKNDIETNLGPGRPGKKTRADFSGGLTKKFRAATGQKFTPKHTSTPQNFMLTTNYTWRKFIS